MKSRKIFGVSLSLILINMAAIMERADENLLPSVYKEVSETFNAGPSHLGYLTFIRNFVQGVTSPMAGVLVINYDRPTVLAMGTLCWALSTAAVGASSYFLKVAFWRFWTLRHCNMSKTLSRYSTCWDLAEPSNTEQENEDLSTSMLRKVLKQVEIIKGSRFGLPNFESHEVEAIDLQVVVDQYLQVRGTVKTARDAKARFGVKKEPSESTTKAWLEKMRTLL